MSEAQRGIQHIAQQIDAGKDPNADLEGAVEKGDSPTRAASAVALRIAGASYSEIARTLGYSSAYNARAAVERALAESPDETDIHRVRQLTSRRLDRLLKSVMPKAVDPRDPDHLAYNARALAIVDRQARLHGVDAPTTAVVITPEREQVERYVAEVLALARAQGEAEEEIIIEADLED